MAISRRGRRFALSLGLFVLAVLPAFAPARAGDAPATLEALGERLFFDTNLSKNRSQSCAMCHSPDHGFADPRETAVGRAASLGDDGKTLGDRNAPTAAYARFAPPFGKGGDGRWRGGLFHDGRAADLEAQAGGPPLNRKEMGMRDEAEVVARLKENPDYVTAFRALFGDKTLDDAKAGYAAMTKALAAFERTDIFAPFDSKYDRFLRGEATLTEQEELGRVLFFSTQFTNCSECHRSQRDGTLEREVFTDHRFHNIGTPRNEALRRHNGTPRALRDKGLGDHPAFTRDATVEGMIKTPTLRNVAVTGPYMHNGVFADLRTVILFYDKYNAKSAARRINPETGKPWAAPENPRNLSLRELEIGPALSDKRVDALVAFLRTLTDKRYERLLDASAAKAAAQ